MGRRATNQFVSRTSLPVSFVLLAACGATSTATPQGGAGAVASDAAEPQAGATATPSAPAGIGSAFCDGSNDIRLGMWLDAGPGNAFMQPFGFRFAFVDGRCRYVASSDAMVGIASGVLDSARVEELARDVSYARIAEFSAHSDEVCFEGGRSAISDGARSFGCGCECDEGAPAALISAEAASHRWIDRLVAEGSLSTGAVRAVAVKYDSGGPYADSPAWPLARPITDILVSEFLLREDAGAIIDDAEDAATLRALRTQAMTRGTFVIYVLDAMQQYYLLVRDEPESPTEAAVRAFRELSR